MSWQGQKVFAAATSVNLNPAAKSFRSTIVTVLQRS